jgi:hypothetical protein
MRVGQCLAWGAFLTSWLVVGGWAPAVAQEPSGESGQQPAESAEALIEEGIALRRAGDDQAAAAAFERAYAASPSPRGAAQLGLARQALGRWVDAHARLTEALAASGDAWVDRNRAALEQALAVVQGEVGSVQILVSGAPEPDVHATVGGREVSPWPMTAPMVVVAGEEAIEVTAPGFRTVRRDVRVRPGQLSRVSIELVPEASGGGVGSTGAGSTGAGSTGAGSTGAGSTGASMDGTATPPADRAAPPGGDEGWIVWVIVGAAVVVGVGVGIAVVASQESLEPPLPGTVGTVELLRW